MDVKEKNFAKKNLRVGVCVIRELADSSVLFQVL